MKRKVRIDVISDVICPWCFLGKRQLDAALARLPKVEATIAWRPFMLDPNVPREGMDRHEYLASKFGEERLATLHDPLVAAGQKEGVPYNFDAIKRTPNSFNAHRLLRWSHSASKQHDMAERLFMAYWNQGRDVGDSDVLSTIAGEAGMDAKTVRKQLDSDLDMTDVAQEMRIPQQMGVNGVPCFIINRTHGVAGAVGPQALVEAINKAMAA